MDSHTVNKPEGGAGPEVKETIKAVAKALEDQKMLDTLTADAESMKRYAYLSALVYSYLESASKLLNKRVQSALTVLKTKYEFLDFNTFIKEKP